MANKISYIDVSDIIAVKSYDFTSSITRLMEIDNVNTLTCNNASDYIMRLYSSFMEQNPTSNISIMVFTAFFITRTGVGAVSMRHINAQIDYTKIPFKI